MAANDWDWTYFVLNETRGTVKIGKSFDVGKRLPSIQTGSSDELRVICIAPDVGPFSERALHERFKKYRIRGEWFSYSEEIKQYCDQTFNMMMKFAETLP